MILRRAELADMAALARLHRRTVRAALPFLPELHTPEEDLAFFETRLFATTEVWLVEAEDIPAGYAAFREGFIEHLFIAPEHQGRGLGRRLLERALQGQSDVTLWTFQKNQRARRFYERHGFVIAKETDGADNEEKEPDVLYAWTR